MAAIHTALETLNREKGELHAENERLRAAIRWALGEAPDDNGAWFGDLWPEPQKARPFWWRTNLRRMAGMLLVYDKEKRTIVRADEQSHKTEI